MSSTKSPLPCQAACARGRQPGLQISPKWPSILGTNFRWAARSRASRRDRWGDFTGPRSPVDAHSISCLACSQCGRDDERLWPRLEATHDFVLTTWLRRSRHPREHDRIRNVCVYLTVHRACRTSSSAALRASARRVIAARDRRTHHLGRAPRRAHRAASNGFEAPGV